MLQRWSPVEVGVSAELGVSLLLGISLSYGELAIAGMVTSEEQPLDCRAVVDGMELAASLAALGSTAVGSH